MSFTNMPYYTEIPDTVFQLRLDTPLDPLNDYTAQDGDGNTANVLQVGGQGLDNNVVIVDGDVEEPLTITNKNNKNDKKIASIISKTPTKFEKEKVSPYGREPFNDVDNKIKNTKDVAISKMLDNSKDAIGEVNDEADTDFEDDEASDDDRLKVVEAKENGAGIFKLLSLM